MAEAPEEQAGFITVKQAAKILMLESERRVQQLASEGWIPRENGRYRTIGVVQGYIKYLQDLIKKRQSNQSENRIRDARAREVELRNAKAEHEVIEFDEAAAVVDEIAGMLKSELIGFGASMTRDQTMRKKIDAGIDAIFARAEARVREALSSLAESGAVVEADTEDETT